MHNIEDKLCLYEKFMRNDFQMLCSTCEVWRVSKNIFFFFFLSDHVQLFALVLLHFILKFCFFNDIVMELLLEFSALWFVFSY